MPTPAPRTDWSTASQLLHWLVAVLILVMAWLGLTMGDLPNGPDKIATYALHKSIGLTVLGLALLRLLVRWCAGVPAHQHRYPARRAGSRASPPSPTSRCTRCCWRCR